MQRVRGGPPDTVRARGDKIATATAITPVFKAAQPPSQDPRRPLKELRAAELRRQRRMRLVKVVHSLGERPVFEAFDKLANDFGESVVDHLLERLANIEPAVLRALGADKLPPPPIHEVRQ